VVTTELANAVWPTPRVKAASAIRPPAWRKAGLTARTAVDSFGQRVRALGKVAERKEMEFRLLRKKRNDRRSTRLDTGRHRSWTVPEPHGSFRVLFSPVWATFAITNRTAEGEKDALPDRRVTTIRVGRELRSVTVRWPIERRTTVQPSSVDSTAAFQSFVIVALIVTSNLA
jgi:hypothetical protein